MLTPWDPFQDALLGNVFSQVSVSSTAVLFCVLGLRNWFIFVFAGAYYLIDLLFVHLGIYQHHWYRSIYTFFGFLVYCWIVKKWYVLLAGERDKIPDAAQPRRAKLHKFLSETTLFMAVFAAAGNTLFTTQKLAELQVFRSGIFPDPSKDHTAAVLIYLPIMLASTMLVHRWKRPPVYKAAALLLLFGFQWALYKIGMLTVVPGWFLWAAILDIGGIYLWTAFLDRLLTGEIPESKH
jgi:hypothetical protein